MAYVIKVAIITRTKDRPVFLKRAIKSVHSQTYTDFTHVIINDGGDSQEVDKLIEQQSSLDAAKIKIIHNKKSTGMEAASNKAIKSVDSTYVAVHDDDDTWHAEFLERTVAHLERTGEAGVVARTNRIDEKLTDGKAKHQKTTRWLPDLKAVSLYRQLIENQMTPITFLYTRKAYESVGGYDETLPVTGDWEFGIRFLLKYDVEFIDPGFALANYHHRKFKKGKQGNTSYGGNDLHRYYVNKIQNKYLREELTEGKLGIGYIMSQNKYSKLGLINLIKKIIPSSLLRRFYK